MKFTATQIAQILQGDIVGDANQEVSDLSKIEEGKPGTLTFLANLKYAEHLYSTKASIAIVNRSYNPDKPIPATLTLIKVDDAYGCFAKLLQLYEQTIKEKARIEQPSFIDPSAKIGDNVYIGAFAYIGPGAVIGSNTHIYPHTYIGNNVKIGDNCVMYSGVKVYRECKIGNNCTIHASTVIGADGFGFAPNQDNVYQKVPQIGNVIIEDNVEIGANTCVDRATLGSTIIRKGVKLDNLVQIAHNVEVGENTVVAGFGAIAGSAKVGKNVMIAGQVGIINHVKVADGVKIAGQSGVGQDITEPNSIVQGSPAFGIGDYKRSYVLFRMLPKLKEQIDTLAKEIKELKGK